MKISAAIFLVIMLSGVSCFKEPQTKGIITVFDKDNTVVGATVSLFQEILLVFLKQIL